MEKSKTTKLSVIEELHLTRQRLLSEHGGVSGLAEYLRRQEANSGVKTVTLVDPAGKPQSRSR
jgi:hypothetical protein